MELETVKTAILGTPKGANIVLEWIRPAKVRKGITEKIEKSVRMVGRMGMEYDNLKVVQAGREDGSRPAENAGLPWGQWAEYPYLIAHKGGFYLRLYTGTSDKVHAKVEWLLNGQPVSRDSIAPMLLASELVSEHGETFTVKVESLTRIHKETEYVQLMQPADIVEHVELVEA